MNTNFKENKGKGMYKKIFHLKYNLENVNKQEEKGILTLENSLSVPFKTKNRPDHTFQNLHCQVFIPEK